MINALGFSELLRVSTIGHPFVRTKIATNPNLHIVEGIPTEVVPEVENEGEDVPKKSQSSYLVALPCAGMYIELQKKKEAKKPVKLLRKIPAKVIQEAVGLAIFTNFVSLPGCGRVC